MATTFNPTAIAKAALDAYNNQSAKPSLTPSASITTSGTVKQPTYTPYEREEFDPYVPMSERPAGTKDWIWSRSIRAKELFDNEQNAKADDTYRKYQTDLTNWQAEQQLQQQELANQNAALTAQGLTPMASLADLPAVQIRQLGEQWSATTDPTLRNSYNQAALALAKNAGYVPQDYVGSVNGIAGLSMAGTPSYEAAYNNTKLNADLESNYYDNLLKQAQANNYLSGGSGSSGASELNAAVNLYKNTGIVNDTLRNAANGQTIKAPATSSDITKIKNDYIASVIETRKSPTDAAAQLAKDAEKLKQLGLSNYDITALKSYINTWNQKVHAGTRKYGLNYK